MSASMDDPATPVPVAPAEAPVPPAEAAVAPATAPAILPSGFTFRFDGDLVDAEPGMSIAAALIASGRRSWRTTRKTGEPRGVFCGIGICFDCLATVNGRPNIRACVTPAQPGDEVSTQDGTGHGDRAV